MATTPKILRNFNVMVDGTVYAGICDELELPNLTILEEEHRAAGMDAPIGVDLGMEKMEMTLTFAELHQHIFRQFGLLDGRAVYLLFRGAKADDTTVEPVEITVRGSYREIPGSTVRNGEKTTMQAIISLRYYRLVINGTEEVEIDVDNFVRRIGGVDQLESIRNAISM